MKVLHVLPSISLKLGGPTEVALNLTRHLNNRGVDTEIATTDDDDGQVISLEAKQSAEYAAVPIYFFRTSRLKVRQFIVSYELVFWLWRNCTRYDVIDIHYFFTFSGTVASLVARLKGVPYTVRPMGQLTEWSLDYKKFRKRLYWYLFDRSMLIHAAAVQCTSEAEADDVRRVCKPNLRCVVQPLGANPPQLIKDAPRLLRQQLLIPDDALVLLFMSRLHPKKRPDLLIRVTQRLVRDGRPIHLVIAGEGDDAYTTQLKASAESPSLSGRVHFLGFVKGTQKDLLLRGSDLFVLPSHSENFGIVVAEALHAGLPVIVTKGVQIAKDLEATHAGAVVSGNEDSLYNSLVSLIDLPECRCALARNGLALAQTRYSWPIIAEQAEEIYQEISRKTGSYEFIPAQEDL